MDRRKKVRSGLSFGIAITIFFILEDLLTYDDPASKNIAASIISCVAGGALGGLLFGWLTGRFTDSKLLKQGTTIVLHENETVIFESGANHFKGAESVGGKLYLTNKVLLFRAHKLNIQNHELSISLSHIDKVARYRTLGIVNNGLSVATTENKIEKFVVEDPDKWFDLLTEKKGIQ